VPSELFLNFGQCIAGQVLLTPFGTPQCTTTSHAKAMRVLPRAVRVESRKARRCQSSWLMPQNMGMVCVCVLLAAPVTYFHSHDMTNALGCFGAPWLLAHQDESTGLAVGAGPQWATVVQHGANANVKATCLHTCAGKQCVQ